MSMRLFSVAYLLIKISNSDKVIFADPEITKGEGIALIQWSPL
ncbi:hypothetical protein [Desulfosporosinus sp.]|nr:hypothetical protein [Desulfosporosinus sp.]